MMAQRQISTIHEVYCTRPGCQSPRNSISEGDIDDILHRQGQRCCHNCGMLLVLDSASFRYLPFKRLGAGGFGKTFLALRINAKHFQEECVIKQFCPENRCSTHAFNFVEGLFRRREAETLRRLGEECQFIPRFLDFFELDNPPISNLNADIERINNHLSLLYITQEYISGQDLDAELNQKGVFSEETVIDILIKVVEILGLVHQRHVIHRDIKPHNIIHDQNDNYYLIDFGAVKEITLIKEIDESDPYRHSTIICKTPGFSPPEQKPGGTVHQSADFYALAATCINLLTGIHPPYQRSEVDQEWDSWLLKARQASPRLYPIFKRMLSFQPQHRYQSAQDILQAIYRLEEPTLDPTQPITTSPMHSPTMKRRHFIGLTTATAAATTIGAVGINFFVNKGHVTWNIATSWKPNLHPTIYKSIDDLCKFVGKMTDEKFKIKLDSTGNNYNVPPLEVLNAVGKGSFEQDGNAIEIQCGHTASYYAYDPKDPVKVALVFGTTLPFGLNARQQNAWLYGAGGLTTMQGLYEALNIIQFPAGNTGAQMGGWFKERVSQPSDFGGRKMRLPPGLAPEVISSAFKVIPYVNITGNEIASEFQSGKLDIAEWIGPYDDVSLGLDKSKYANYYYYPGWWEPATGFELQVNLRHWKELSPSYQEILKAACWKMNVELLAQYDDLNRNTIHNYLKDKLNQNGEPLLVSFETGILQEAYEAAFNTYRIKAEQFPEYFGRIFQNWSEFREKIRDWHNYNELGLNCFQQDYC